MLLLFYSVVLLIVLFCFYSISTLLNHSSKHSGMSLCFDILYLFIELIVFFFSCTQKLCLFWLLEKEETLPYWVFKMFIETTSCFFPSHRLWMNFSQHFLHSDPGRIAPSGKLWWWERVKILTPILSCVTMVKKKR